MGQDVEQGADVVSERRIRQMLEFVRQGQPVELPIPSGSVKKAAELASIAQQFGYEYADAQWMRERRFQLLLVPDPSPQARVRAAQNWARYPNAGDGVSLPPVVPEAFELLRARITFDLTGNNAQLPFALGGLFVTVMSVICAVRFGTDALVLVIGGVMWSFFMTSFGIGFVVMRKRHARAAAQLRAAGFVPVTEGGGRVRYLPPGAQATGRVGQELPYASGPYGNAYGPPHGWQYGRQHPPGPYADPRSPYPQYGPGPYTPPQPPGPYRPQ
ncbi:hypothetical protein [Streptomyces triticisoli]|uniref:hypothetical protein n=1 Tax=Streptomyces triticisoli TaxID=2182797 RepID=UPI001E462A9A|nr:hypothetical protein [Streptomyces triticisoli]